MVQSFGKKFIGLGFAEGNSSRFKPDFSLVGSTRYEVERQSREVFFLSIEIALKESFFQPELLPVEFKRDRSLFEKSSYFFEPVLVFYETGKTQPFLTFGEENLAPWEVKEGVEHGLFKCPCGVFRPGLEGD